MSSNLSGKADGNSALGTSGNPEGLVPTPTLQSFYRGPAETLLGGDSHGNNAANVGGGSGCEFITLPLASYVNSNSGSSERSGKLPFDVINLRYDLTPIGNISVVATEAGLIPPTSIPVLIRELASDFGGGR